MHDGALGPGSTRDTERDTRLTHAKPRPERVAKLDVTGECATGVNQVADSVGQRHLKRETQPAGGGDEEFAIEHARRTTEVACTLSATAFRDRSVAWTAVLATSISRRSHTDGLTIFFDATANVEELARLVAAEAECCPFLSLTVQRGPTPSLTIQSPPDAGDLVREMFGVHESLAP